MFDATPLLRLYARYRLNRLATLDPVEVQRDTLRRLIRRARDTRFGVDHRFRDLRDVADYQRRVPLRTYEDFWRDYWKPVFPNLRDASWPGLVPYFAVTSGTTTGRSKYIPVTSAMLRSNAKAGADLYAFHLRARPASRIMGGRSFMLGGSTSLVREAAGVRSGDLSGITVAEMPWFARPRYFPPEEIALIEDWEEKIAVLSERSVAADIRMIGGVPSWLLLYFEQAMASSGAVDVHALYPNLELLVHGGVSFAPYRERFERLLVRSRAEMREVYPASEGFVAIADGEAGRGLRLSLDHGLFFEFVPVEELDRQAPTRHWLATVETGINYAVVVTTCAGLWSYVIGDTVTFVDGGKRHIVITGRTAQMLSAFGEHIIVSELDAAMAAAAHAMGRSVSDYAVGALHPAGSARGRHLAIVELASDGVSPDVAEFAKVMDLTLKDENDDYRSYRADGFGLDAPEVLFVAPGTFAAWMKGRHRLGGQNKVPRIILDAAMLADLRAFAVARAVK